MTPPFETGRAQSELFTFQCGQCQNSQLEDIKKCHQVNHDVKLAELTSELFTFQSGHLDFIWNSH